MNIFFFLSAPHKTSLTNSLKKTLPTSSQLKVKSLFISVLLA